MTWWAARAFRRRAFSVCQLCRKASYPESARTLAVGQVQLDGDPGDVREGPLAEVGGGCPAVVLGGSEVRAVFGSEFLPEVGEVAALSSAR
jgi:hypothetical protein